MGRSRITGVSMFANHLRMLVHLNASYFLCPMFYVSLAVPYRWTGDVCSGALVQTGSEAVKVRLVRQREAAEVPHTGGDRRRPLAVLRHQGTQLQLWTAQCHHVRAAPACYLSKSPLLLSANVCVGLSLLLRLLLLHMCASLLCSHIRWGAPPVINPIGSTFPNSTLWSPGLSLILPVTSHSSTTFNLSDPAPGDWYVAAHLPEDDGRIEQKVRIAAGFCFCCYGCRISKNLSSLVSSLDRQTPCFLK